MGPQYPAGPGRSEVMGVASLSPCSGRRQEPRPGLRGSKCHGTRDVQILEDQGLRPNTEADTSYPLPPPEAARIPSEGPCRPFGKHGNADPEKCMVQTRA